LLARGDRVIATCRHPAKASALNRLAGEHPGHLHVLPLDVADPRSRHALIGELALVLEDAPLHLLINNAGVLRGGERFGQVRGEDVETSFRTHALGPLLLVQELAPRLAAGAVVANISSEIGSISQRREFRTPSYAIGKAAQNMVSALLAAALAPRDIRVVALHPGWVRTDMGGENAVLAPAESVAGLLRVIEELPAADSGHFFDWRGQAMPW
jgi:NAD(P)-dependent dehydrogenase (short-subunit alcohol dehydrogenase family)